MSIEIASTNGLFQLQVNESYPREILVRNHKRGARWWSFSRHDTTEDAVAALLAAKDNEDSVLRVTIEVVPFGIEQLAKTIRTIEIANDLSTDGPETGSYDVLLKMPSELTVEARVEGHIRADGALKLVGLALDALERATDARDGAGGSE